MLPYPQLQEAGRGPDPAAGLQTLENPGAMVCCIPRIAGQRPGAISILPMEFCKYGWQITATYSAFEIPTHISPRSPIYRP